MKKPIEATFIEFGNNRFLRIYFGFAWQYGLNYTDIKSQTLQDKELTFFLENNIREVISSLMGKRLVESHENKKILFTGKKNLYGQWVDFYLMMKLSLMKRLNLKISKNSR